MTALTLFRIWRGGLALAVLAGMPALAGVVSVYVGTANNNLANWQVWAAGSGWVTPMYAVNANVSPDVQPDDWAMSLSTDGGSLGSLVSGFDPVGWNGVWLARTTFYLPADAVFAWITVEPKELASTKNPSDPDDPAIRYATDDRAALQLNGMDPCGGANSAAWMYERGYHQIEGEMNTALFGSNLHPCNFLNADAMEIDSFLGAPFKFGSSNNLYLWVNNTGSFDPNAPTVPFGPGDLTYAGFDASVYYYVVPEPHAFWLVLTSVGLMSVRRWRRTWPGSPLRSPGRTQLDSQHGRVTAV